MIFELPLSYSQGGLLSSAKMLERLGQNLQQGIKSPLPDDGKRERNDSFLTILLFLFFGDVLIDIINIRVGLFYVLLNA